MLKAGLVNAQTQQIQQGGQPRCQPRNLEKETKTDNFVSETK